MWSTLNTKQKIKYVEYMNSVYGKTAVRSESGEPLYFSDGCLINSSVIIQMLFSVSNN